LKYDFIDQVKKAFPITILCNTMKVSRSGYYNWRQRKQSKKMTENQKLIPLVREIHNDCKGTYGTRRMAKQLQMHQVPCGRARARTLMKLADVNVKHRKKHRVTTNSKHRLPVAENLLDRHFKADAPNQKWVSDITYVWTREGWLYVAAVMDLFSRQIVGWAIDHRINQDLVTNALHMALWRRRPEPGLLFHSDRGSQYCSHKFQRIIKDQKIIISNY
jgi:putative transposase